MSADDIKKFLERKDILKCRLLELNRTVEIDLAFSFEQHFEARAYTYFTTEERLQTFEDLFFKIGDQIDAASDMSDLTRVAERLAYVEDRLDEVESQLYNRPRRRRRPFNFADFFSRFSRQGGDGSAVSQGEISSISEAYQILELEEGCGLLEVTAAFRRFAKAYHPDSRGGDRSDEGRLRKIVEAYQLIKQHLSESGR